MDITVRLAFDESAAVRLLNWLARENARIFKARPDLPGVYEAGVRYERETVETWSDVLYLYRAGHEDCDALAAARAGEIMARGWRALSLARNDSGAAYASLYHPTDIYAEVVLRTKTDPGIPGLYHCIVRYRVGNVWYYDDPSARLGMYGFRDLRQPGIQRVATHNRQRIVW